MKQPDLLDETTTPPQSTEVVGMGKPLRQPRRHVLAVVSALVGAGAFLAVAGAAAAAPSGAPGKPVCTVNFSVSDDHPAVGQDITLSWTSSGADQLVASWTS